MWFFCIIIVWLRLVLNKFQILTELINIYDIQQFIFVLLYIPKTNKRTKNPSHYRGKAQQHPKEEEKDSWKVKKPLLVSGLCLVPTNMTTIPLNNVLPNWLRRRSVPKLLKFNWRFSPRDWHPSPEGTQQNRRVIFRSFSYFRSNFVNSFPKLSTEIYCSFRITIGNFITIQLFFRCLWMG